MSGLFDQSYQPWEGRLQGRAFRLFAITWTSVLNTCRRSPLALAVCAGLAILISVLSLINIVGLSSDPGIMTFLSLDNAATFALLLVLPVAGSGLVANDIKHNALLMYFSKSIYRADYMAGKALSAFLLMVVPLLLSPLIAGSIGIYGLGDKISNWYTVKLVLALMACVPVAAIPAIALLMAFSACTRRTFLAGIGWVVVYLILQSVSGLLSAAKFKWAYMLSFSGNILRIGTALTPAAPEDASMGPMSRMIQEVVAFEYSAWYSVAILAAVTVGSFAIVNWRISNAERRS